MKTLVLLASLFVSSQAFASDLGPVSSKEHGDCYGYYLGEYQPGGREVDPVVCFKTSSGSDVVGISFYPAGAGSMKPQAHQSFTTVLTTSQKVVTAHEDKWLTIYSDPSGMLDDLVVETWFVAYSGTHGRMTFQGKKFTIYHLM